MRDSEGWLTLGRGKKRNECKAGRKSSRKPTRSFAYTRPTSQIPLHFFDTLLHTSTCTRLFSAPYSFPLLFKRVVSSAFSFLQRIRSSLMPPYHYGYDIRHTRQTTSGYSIKTTSYPALTGNAFFPRASACDDKKWGENFSSPEWVWPRCGISVPAVWRCSCKQEVDVIDTHIWNLFKTSFKQTHYKCFYSMERGIYVYAVKPSMKLSWMNVLLLSTGELNIQVFHKKSISLRFLHIH